MIENNVSPLLFLSDVETMKDTKKYKIFSNEIPIFKTFFTIDENGNIEEILESAEFGEFETNFKKYIKYLYDNGTTNFNCILHILEFFYSKRPKLVKLLVPLTEIFLDFYSSEWDKIEQYARKSINNDEFRENIIRLIKNIKNKESRAKKVSDFKYYPECYVGYQMPKKIRDVMLNLERYIFEDDVDKFSEILWMNYEGDLYDEIFTFLLNISCKYGSIKCFKYLLMNNCKFNNVTTLMAVFGGNNEIIQILNQRNVSFDHLLLYSIAYHRYAISDWLIINFNIEAFHPSRCLLNYNFEAFLLFDQYVQLYKIDDMSIYSALSFIGILHLLKFFSDNENAITLNRNECIERYIISRPINFAAGGHNMPVIKYLISKGVRVSIYDPGFPFCDYTPEEIIHFVWKIDKKNEKTSWIVLLILLFVVIFVISILIHFDL